MYFIQNHEHTNKLKFSVTHINIRHMDYQDADMVQKLHDNQLSTIDLGIGGKPDAWWRCTQEKPYMEWYNQTFVGGKGQWRKRNIFQEGKVTLPNFFLVWNMLVHPTQISVVWKSDKPKKKKGPLLIFILSPFHFQFSTSSLSNFLLFLSILPFFLAPFFPVGQQKFPCEKRYSTGKGRRGCQLIDKRGI